MFLQTTNRVIDDGGGAVVLFAGLDRRQLLVVFNPRFRAEVAVVVDDLHRAVEAAVLEDRRSTGDVPFAGVITPIPGRLEILREETRPSGKPSDRRIHANLLRI